jgi:hypothetical protein
MHVLPQGFPLTQFFCAMATAGVSARSNRAMRRAVRGMVPHVGVGGVGARLQSYVAAAAGDLEVVAVVEEVLGHPVSLGRRSTNSRRGDRHRSVKQSWSAIIGSRDCDLTGTLSKECAGGIRVGAQRSPAARRPSCNDLRGFCCNGPLHVQAQSGVPYRYSLWNHLEAHTPKLGGSQWASE